MVAYFAPLASSSGSASVRVFLNAGFGEDGLRWMGVLAEAAGLRHCTGP